MTLVISLIDFFFKKNFIEGAMVDKVSMLNEDKTNTTRKRNIQGLLGLLKMKNEYGDAEYKNFRVQKNEFQRKILKDVYKLTKFPSKQTRDDLALLLNHTNRGIQIWFQNQRNSREDKTGNRSDSNQTTDSSDNKPKKATVDISVLIDIVEKNIPNEKRDFWERFINHVSHLY